MTRWARPGHNNNTPSRNRKVCAATPWGELYQQRASPAKRAACSAEERAPRAKRRKDAYENQDVNGFLAQQQGDQDWKDERREGRRQRRQDTKKSKMICFHCRKPGHGMSDCAEALRCQEMGTGICFRCGSTEHEINKCRAKVDPALGEYPYAKCFICGEMGHLSRSCPDNPKGLYAEGGGCRICGSVEHFQRDCPDHQTSAQMTVGRWSNGMSADHEDVPVTQKVHKLPTKTPKIVTF